MTHEFDDVARAELSGLLRYATVLCGDPEQARDIVQDVLARAYVRWHQVGGADRPAAYLMRMVTNEFLSWRRRWATRAISPVGDSRDLDGVGRADGFVDHGSAIVERHDLTRRLSALPRRQQAALVLRFFEGLDYAESAQLLGCAEGTVRSAVSRGLAALRLDGASDTPRTTTRSETR